MLRLTTRCRTLVQNCEGPSGKHRWVQMHWRRHGSIKAEWICRQQKGSQHRRSSALS